MKKPSIFCCLIPLFFFLSYPLGAKVQFTGIDLSPDNRFLFTAESLGARQKALFVSRLDDLSLQQLTAFPERLELLENNRTLQVRSVFGAVRIPVSGGLPRSILGFPSFAGGASVSGGRVENIAPSADGRWILQVEPVSSAYGNLALIDVQTGAKTIVASHVERPDMHFPACWSPDSRVFVYVHGNKLYYYAINAASISLVDEKYRLIGEGAINSVYWGNAGDFFYLRGSTVYRVRGSELFARTLYAGFLEIGVMAGQIPFDFDPSFDSFWIAPDSRSMLLAKGGRNIFYYPLDTKADTGNISLPYLMIPWSSYKLAVLWSPGGVITLVASVLGKNGGEIMAFRLNTAAPSMTFNGLAGPVGGGAALSPDGTKALFWGEKGVVLYDYINWRLLQTVSTRPAFSCIWMGNEEFITGDERRIERVRISGKRDLVCLAGTVEAAFEEAGNRILVREGGVWFATDGYSSWAEADHPAVKRASLVSDSYRVYLEKQLAGPYVNLPMIRDIRNVGTIPLFSAGGEESSAGISPAGGIVPSGRSMDIAVSSGEDNYFSYGRRNGTRELALCFDLYDDASGLPTVLDALKEFGIRATFFLNGEFIRRHPEAAAEIAGAGHEAASMFFTPIDLSDARYLVGGDFVSRGLARNEDEFFQATGGELSLLWHPPYYAVSADIIAVSAKAGYKTIGRDIDPMDWVSRGDARRIGLEQRSASEMVDLIMEQKQPGSIIPIRLGLLAGGRSDYLYNRINVLLDALTRSGYDVVTVSALLEHAR
ncbi:MAG: polysaccharide deacetylase family protein [Treponema sp.]|jgi:peptidoglycan/xylan/chitin deacetylase (PgdA/CDA1 family)|nr:polysaccharide deacetylase family protein [Treponema sp.]